MLRIATRKSLLARRQAEIVAAALLHSRGVECELVLISTRGDQASGSLVDSGGKGLFTADLEAALKAGQADLAVHSAKDMPAEIESAFVIAAVPPRADARDAIVSRHGGLRDLPHGARVGTSSPRRAAQLKRLREDLELVPIRGNVDTRLRKTLHLAPGDSPLGTTPGAKGGPEFDAVVLAMAGLIRGGFVEEFGPAVHPLSLEEMVPAAGQGALAVECLSERAEVRELLAAIDDRPSHEALAAERWVLTQWGADCRSCVAVHVYPKAGQWQAIGMIETQAGIRLAKGEGAQAQDAVRKMLAGLE